MNGMIEKKVKAANVFKIVLWVILAISVISCIAMLIPVFAFGLVLLLILWCVYATNYGPALRNSKWLAAKGYTNAADEFTVNMPVYRKSNIICGARSLMIKNKCVVLPYAEIAWMYIQVRKAYGLITVGKSILIFTRDGNSYTTGGDVEELQDLLSNHVLRANPNVLVGFGAEQQRRYREIKAANKG